MGNRERGQRPLYLGTGDGVADRRKSQQRKQRSRDLLPRFLRVRGSNGGRGGSHRDDSV